VKGVKKSCAAWGKKPGVRRAGWEQAPLGGLKRSTMGGDGRGKEKLWGEEGKVLVSLKITGVQVVKTVKGNCPNQRGGGSRTKKKS